MIEHFIAEAVVGAERELVENAVLIFDGPRKETKTIRGIRVTIGYMARLGKKLEVIHVPEKENRPG